MSNWQYGWFNREPEPVEEPEPDNAGLWRSLTRASESFWRSQTPIQAPPHQIPFRQAWANVQITGPEIQASANQYGAFTATMIAEYQRYVNDARNSIADNLGYNQLTWRGKPFTWDRDAPKPPLHDAWLMEDADL